MLVTPTRNSARRRSAFTLLEVLVVVAILVVLASVASIAVFRYLDDAKKDKAMLDMQALETVYKSYVIKNDVPPDAVTIQDLAPLMTQGGGAMVDPWGNPYQIRFVQGPTEVRAQFFTVSPDGQEITWPRR